jgi:5-methylcytosine-specific restriction protein A
VILRRDKGLCQCPECLGGDKRLRVATEVDHIKPKAEGGTDDESNLRAVNSDCHKRLTALQNGQQPRTHIGRDGWPIP